MMSTTPPRALSRRHRQRGQSMAEFLVALAVLYPLYLAVQYAGRYGDILQTMQQASRYAAMQRVMQPDAGILADSKIQDQTKARFFVHGNAIHQGKIQTDDSAAAAAPKKNQSAIWRDLKTNPLLTSMDKITVTMAPVALNTSAVAEIETVMAKSASKTWHGGNVAQVEVELTNKLDLMHKNPAPFKLAAATAAAGDGLGSAGSKATRDAAATIVPSTLIPTAVTDILDLAIEIFEKDGPQFGCIKPDVVPNGRLVGYHPVQACMM